MAWNPATTSASLPSARRYLGVSLSRMTVIRATLITKTKAPAVYITYRQPMLLSFVQMDVCRPVLLSIGSGQFHFGGATETQPLYARTEGVGLTQESPSNKSCDCLSQTPPSSKKRLLILLANGRSPLFVGQIRTQNPLLVGG